MTNELDLHRLRRRSPEAVERWFHHDWMRIEPKLGTSVVEGISVFFSLFDDSPAVKRLRSLCEPPKPLATKRRPSSFSLEIP